MKAGVGHGIQSKELVSLAKRIYDSPKAVSAKMERDGSFVAAPEGGKP
jgi:hypothetical protein